MKMDPPSPANIILVKDKETQPKGLMPQNTTLVIQQCSEALCLEENNQCWLIKEELRDANLVVDAQMIQSWDGAELSERGGRVPGRH